MKKVARSKLGLEKKKNPGQDSGWLKTINGRGD